MRWLRTPTPPVEARLLYCWCSGGPWRSTATLNDAGDRDRGWSVELALPWASLADQAGRPAPPQPGDVWRVNFSRVEWRHDVVDGDYRRIPGTTEDNWVWSPQGVINMHLPHMWGHVEFR